MKLSVRDLSFGYNGQLLFNNLNADLNGGSDGRPLILLGPSGCGKTTLLKLLGGLLKPGGGDIHITGDETPECPFDNKDEYTVKPPKTSFIFQESRLLPWLTVLENIALPLEKIFGKAEARERGRYFLSQVFLEEKETAYPKELSGGQAQRVSMARAFAWPAPALFMDEPFQSLDIPLRISLMDLTLSLLQREKFANKNNPDKDNSSNDNSTNSNSPNDNSKNYRLLIAVTHDPREAVYMAGRIIILGNPGEGIVFDKIVDLKPEDRAYGSVVAAELESELIQKIGNWQ